MSAQKIVMSKEEYENEMLYVADRVRGMVEKALPEEELLREESPVEEIAGETETLLMDMANGHTINVDENGNELTDDNSVAFPMDEDEDQEVDETEADCADCDDETDEAGTQ